MSVVFIPSEGVTSSGPRKNVLHRKVLDFVGDRRTTKAATPVHDQNCYGKISAEDHELFE